MSDSDGSLFLPNIGGHKKSNKLPSLGVPLLGNTINNSSPSPFGDRERVNSRGGQRTESSLFGNNKAFDTGQFGAEDNFGFSPDVEKRRRKKEKKKKRKKKERLVY